MKKRIGLLAALLLTGASVQAAMQTDVQEITISPTGTFAAPDILEFDRFDAGLGALTGVFFRYQIETTGGSVTYDNMVDTPQSFYAKITRSFGLRSIDGVDFIDENGALLAPSLQDPHHVSSGYEQLYLEADPTESIGGNGPDVATLTLPDYSFDSGFSAVGQDYLEDFMGSGSFRSEIYHWAGYQGGGKDVHETLEMPYLTTTMSMYYTYDSATSDVSSPMALGLLGLALLGAGAHRRRG